MRTRRGEMARCKSDPIRIDMWLSRCTRPSNTRRIHNETNRQTGRVYEHCRSISFGTKRHKEAREMVLENVSPFNNNTDFVGQYRITYFTLISQPVDLSRSRSLVSFCVCTCEIFILYVCVPRNVSASSLDYSFVINRKRDKIRCPLDRDLPALRRK